MTLKHNTQRKPAPGDMERHNRAARDRHSADVSRMRRMAESRQRQAEQAQMQPYEYPATAHRSNRLTVILWSGLIFALLILAALLVLGVVA